MPSEEEQQPGPSGISPEEILTLLGLNVSDSEDDDEEEETTVKEEEDLRCYETLDDSKEEEDLQCNLVMDEIECQCEEEDLQRNLVMDDFERQRAFQTQLLEQSGGGIDPETPVGTFEFDLEPYVGVRERHFTTRLRQTGNFVDTPHVVQALRDALQRAMTRTLNDIPDLHDDDRLYFNIISNRLSRDDFHCWGLRVREWREGGDRVDAVLNRLSRALNGNEQFEMDDSFQMSITQVRHAPQRGAGGKRQLRPGHQTLALLKPKKKSIVQIRNTDDLCCARALVTANAKVDRHPKWWSFRDGKTLQKERALLLHHEANVPFGPCGYEELTQFSKAPSLVEYQIVLVDADSAFHITSFGPPAPDKQLILLHEKGHYDVITILKSFLGRSYVCSHCFKPYDQAGKHHCKIKIQCRCCLQKDCPDFHYAYPRGLKATQRCHDCGRDFFGDTCFEAHQSKTHEGKTAEVHQHSICFNRRRCVGCRKLEVGLKYIERHQCGHLDCPSCCEYVNAQTHRCFIQKALSPQEKKEQKKERKRKRQQKRGPPGKRGAAAGLQTLRANEGGDDDDSDGEEPPPPLHVFFDVEAMQPQEQHVANLIVAETEEDSRPVRFHGEQCLRDFLEWLDNSDPRGHAPSQCPRSQFSRV